MLRAVAQVCVLAAAAFPTEVGQNAWEVQGGAAAGAGGGSGPVWSTKVLAELATRVGGHHGGQLLAGALHSLEQWGGECGVADRPVGASVQLEQLLEQAAADMLRDAEWLEPIAVSLLPPLCELRAMLRVCSNPDCVALPPPGQTEAEAEAEAAAGGGRSAGRGTSTEAWYCCDRCRKQHGMEGLAQAQAQQGGDAAPA